MNTIQVKVLLLYIVDFYLDPVDEAEVLLREQDQYNNRFIRVVDQFPSEFVDKINNNRIDVVDNPLNANSYEYIDFLFFIAEDFAESIETNSYDKQILSLTQETFPNLDELSLMSIEATLEVALIPEEDADSNTVRLIDKIDAIDLVRFDNIKQVSSSWVKAQ
jgi:hypothetical protein